jgi:hypothetical protein
LVEDENDDLDALKPTDDVARTPGETSDPPWLVQTKVPADIFQRFEVISYRNAAVILSERHNQEFNEILDALREFSISSRQIRMAGGNESEIPKIISASLRPKNWHETIVQGDLLVRLTWREQTGVKRGKAIMENRSREMRRENHLDGHKIDYVKGRVAFDLEWNSKDQTFDRDLYAFNAFSQCGLIDAAIMLTRSEALNAVFRSLGPALKKNGEIDLKPDGTPRLTRDKYGASTTWMGKLLYRLNAGRNGGCPVLALGIKPACISDWTPA